MNLGKEPWKFDRDSSQHYTLCGCYPKPQKEQKSMIRKPSAHEKVQAILDARQDVAQYLQTIGKIEVFNDFTKDDIAGLIRAAQEGVQKSLRRQCAEGFGYTDTDQEIPF